MAVRGVIFASGIDRSDALNAAAEQYGLPARVITAQAIAESNLDEQAEHWGTGDDKSFGPFQQTARWAPIGDQTNRPANLALVRQRFIEDFAFALDVAAAQLGHYWQVYHDPLETASRYNGGPGLAFADNPNAAHIRDAWEQSALYEVPDMPTERHYDSATSPERQISDWTCSVRTACWCLRSIGVETTAADMQDAMVAAGLVTPALGLLDGSGAGLTPFLARASGCETGSQVNVSWAWLQAHAGQGPIGLGSGSLYHWLAVRRVNADGSLACMNPAPGYRSLGDTMTEQGFNDWAPWTAVYITVAAVEPPPAPAPEQDLPAQIADLQQQLQAEKSYSGALGFNILRPTVAELDELLKSSPVQQLESGAGVTLREAAARIVERLRPYVIAD